MTIIKTFYTGIWKQLSEKFKDYDERLHYEIQNLFRYNHRLVSGQLSIFVPFLYEDLLSGGPERAFLSKQMVQESLDQLRALDFSLFYREFLYMNKELGIEKEYRMAEILHSCADLLGSYRLKQIIACIKAESLK